MDNMAGFGSMFGTGLKAEKVANQVDSEAKTGIRTLENGKVALKQFDIVEQNLETLMNMAQQEGNIALAGQFQQMKMIIDSVQSQVDNTFTQAYDSFRAIDSLTDKIQN